MASLADFDASRGCREKRANVVANERVKQNDIGAFNSSQRAKGQKVG